MDDALRYVIEDLSAPLLHGAAASLQLIVCSVPFGLMLGFAVAVGWVYGNRAVSALCKAYVLLVKGTPLLILLFVIYFCLPSLGLTLSPFAASVTGFIMCNGAYNSEYIRGAILSVRSGQLIAARSLGMGRFQAIVSIVLPQAARRALPGCSNEVIYLIKYSSLAYILSFIELTGAGKMAATRSFRFTLVFSVVGLVYLTMVTLASLFFMWLEKKLAIPGFETTRD
ncbi:MAG: amino acid ABC transporter permease [Synergistaceae bacterium]|jgi:polar amino acid transport system permease protein|nr:amino acid ABC transporter permease [Synergistaceae bacterium]